MDDSKVSEPTPGRLSTQEYALLQAILRVEYVIAPRGHATAYHSDGNALVQKLAAMYCAEDRELSELRTQRLTDSARDRAAERIAERIYAALKIIVPDSRPVSRSWIAAIIDEERGR